ncbi:hypothetical protein [Streptomyces achromogenes]|uniref:hypothetical protein n=1 Tax=Streptomyces achromogenes TaxID=67255 RepID=UPI00369973E4
MPAFSPASASQNAQATNTLTSGKEYLRGNPPVADTVPLPDPLLDTDTDTGVPVLLGDILRDAARLASDQTDQSVTDEIRLIIDGLRVMPTAGKARG